MKISGKIYSRIFGININSDDNIQLHPSSIVIGGWDVAMTPEIDRIMWFDLPDIGGWQLDFEGVKYSQYELPLVFNGRLRLSIAKIESTNPFIYLPLPLVLNVIDGIRKSNR